MKGRAAIAAILTVLAGSVTAQEPPVVRLSVDQAVERALEHAPRLRMLDANQQAAAAAVSQARADELPRLDVSAGYTRYSDIPELSFPSPGGASVLFPNIPNVSRTRVGARYPLYTGGRLEGLVEAARGEEASAEGQIESSRRDLVFETRRSYWRLVTAVEKVMVLAENTTALKAHLVDARNRERFGLAARNEVLAVEVERDRSELARLRAETEALLAQENARRLLGLRPGERLEPVDTLAPSRNPSRDVESLVFAAVEGRSEIAVLEAKLGAVEARARVERAAKLPQVSVGAGYLYAHPNPRFLPPEAEWNGNWEVSVEVALSVFDGGRASASEARARSQAEAIRAEIVDLEERIRLEVVSAYLEVANSESATSIALRAVEAARESLRVASERYREGVLLSSELLDAEVALRRAELDRTEALAAERLAAAALDRAVGR